MSYWDDIEFIRKRIGEQHWYIVQLWKREGNGLSYERFSFLLESATGILIRFQDRLGELKQI